MLLRSNLHHYRRHSSILTELSTPSLAPLVHLNHHLFVYDPIPAHSRQPTGILASIWAPQPQPSGTTWPKSPDTFSRVAELQSNLHPVFPSVNLISSSVQRTYSSRNRKNQLQLPSSPPSTLSSSPPATPRITKRPLSEISSQENPRSHASLLNHTPCLH